MNVRHFLMKCIVEAGTIDRRMKKKVAQSMDVCRNEKAKRREREGSPEKFKVRRTFHLEHQLRQSERQQEPLVTLLSSVFILFLLASLFSTYLLSHCISASSNSYFVPLFRLSVTRLFVHQPQ